jgi:hypothetical protein
MKRITATKHHGRRRPAALLSLGAVGLALVVAGCGSATGSSVSPVGYRAPGARPTPAAPATTVSTPVVAAARSPKPVSKSPVAATVTSPAHAIPQQNGGDGDPDNNGAPSDGDGNM